MTRTNSLTWHPAAQDPRHELGLKGAGAMEVGVHAAAAVHTSAADARRLAAVLVGAPIAHTRQVILHHGKTDSWVKTGTTGRQIAGLNLAPREDRFLA